MEVHEGQPVARVSIVQVVLRKLGRGSRAVTGRLVRAPRKGSVVVIEFSDGMHEYVTTPVKRVLRLAPKDVFYIETVNSRYRLEVRDSERSLDDASSGWVATARGPAVAAAADTPPDASGRLRTHGSCWPFARDSAISSPATGAGGRAEQHESTMGRFDRRNSMKMKRRRAQTKKKARVKKRTAKPAAAPAPRKSRASAAN
jgi:hypothetical protein